jgi:hypothetical protein
MDFFHSSGTLVVGIIITAEAEQFTFQRLLPLLSVTSTINKGDNTFFSIKQ